MALAVAVIVVERKRDAIPPREERARPEARGGHELEQLLEDAPYRPDVDRAVVRLLQDHLRRTVPPRDHVVGHLRLQWRRHRRVGPLAFDLLAERAARQQLETGFGRIEGPALEFAFLHHTDQIVRPRIVIADLDSFFS